MTSTSGRRILILTALTALTLVLSIAPTALAGGVPSNDRFQDAIAIKPGSLPTTRLVDTTGATEQSAEPETQCSSQSASVWFAITPNRNMVLLADTIGSDYDASINVYRGTHLQGLQEVACNDDIDGIGAAEVTDARVAFKVKAGVRYSIAVSDDDGDEGGSLVLNLRTTNPPANDAFDGAQWINHYPFEHTINNAHATNQRFERDDECSDLMATLWYKTEPASDMVLRADTFGTGFDTMLAVYQGGPGTSQLDRIACIDDTDPGGVDNESSLAWRAKKDVIYYIAVGGYDASSGPIDFKVRHVTPPANDQFDDADVILATGTTTAGVSGLPFLDSQNGRNATIQKKEPFPTCSSGSYSTVWYRYTAPADLALEASVDMGDGSAVVQVYQGTSLSDLVPDESACGSTAFFSVSSGQTYWLQVAAEPDDAGPMDFSLSVD